MGTAVTVRVREGRARLGPAWAWLEWVDATFSPFRADSEIARIGAGALAARDAHPLVRDVLARCDALHARTRGYFSASAGGRLDPSGLVKGWAADRAAALVEAGGARCFCVDAGGDVVLRGGPWRVGVRHPREPHRVAAVLELRDAAVATSGAYERGAHVVDPHTGRPPAGVVSVTVVGRELATADAYATAAYAMGADGPAWTVALRGHGAMTILDGDRVLTTPRFRRHRAG